MDGEFIKWPTTNQKYMCCFFRSVSLAQMMERGAGGGGKLKAFLYQTLRRLISTRIAKNKDFPFAVVGND